MYEFERILIVDDNEDVLFALKLLLKKYAKEVLMEMNPKRIPFLMNQHPYDVILLDMNFSRDTTSGKEGFEWLAAILERQPQAAVVMITAYGSIETAVLALKAGATDFVLKPWDNKKIVETLRAAKAQKQAQGQNKAAAPKRNESLSDDFEPENDTTTSESGQTKDPLSYLIGESEAMKQVTTILKKVATTDANILILGENGTGKEVIAQAIHALSSRKKSPFVSVDMGAITETLFESELFGHKKGAFTDAKEDRIGRFEAAHKGTLFLDEIGNLSLPLQTKLLTALQKREIIRVGTNKAISVDIRLVCATNMPLYEMVRQNEFRQDLLYRINTIEIKLPPLRERGRDVLLLAQHFIKIYTKKYQMPLKKLGSEAQKKLLNYHFPGNVRELQHAIERAIIMSEEDTLQAGDFLFLVEQEEANDLDIQDYNLENVEKLVIQKAISKHGGNISHAAKALGLTRAALYRRLEKYGL
ncbi:sigma-54-dependent transcriptional regulator [Hugenholtzia roseola]|uniref:sigma-54-dependent transcriptional regulator n=1 Tax=Hugenholtzia roseola TaxID=1002 RepID=UPI000422DFFE|nr:sigma-54 dependent transcriptional regulator [Hugenholtzia roseola]